MKRLEDILIAVIIIFLSIHLFTLHSKLLFHLNPDKTIELLNYSFSAKLFNSDMIVSTLSAIAYSLITALILAIFVKFKRVFLLSVISFAILDGIGVFVYYNIGISDDTFIIIGAVYYALYTIFIIVSLGTFRNLAYKDIELNNKVDDAIQETDVIQIRGDMNKILNNKNKYLSLEDKVIQAYYNDELSQQKIASKLNISQSKVSRILNKSKDE